jgi:hypothetical protein
MKFSSTYLIYLLTLALLTPTISWSWERKRPSRQYDVRPEQMDQHKNRQSLLNQSRTNRGSTHEIAKSDVGLQRPVKAKKKGFGYKLGFSSKIYHSNNPLSTESGQYKVSAGVWENSLNNNFLLGAYDLRGATFSPIVSLSYTNFNHFGHELVETIDFGSLTLNFAGIFTFGKGWSLRPSLGYTADFSLEDGMSRLYSQLSPSLALGKSFSMGKAQSFLEWSLGYSFTDSPAQLVSKDLLDRFETALTWGVSIPFGDFEFSPYLRLSLADYSNQSKTDTSTNLGLDLTYSITDWMALRIYSTLSSRSSNNDKMDFTRLDTGAGATLNARF